MPAVRLFISQAYPNHNYNSAGHIGGRMHSVGNHRAGAGRKARNKFKGWKHQVDRQRYNGNPVSCIYVILVQNDTSLTPILIDTISQDEFLKQIIDYL